MGPSYPGWFGTTYDSAYSKWLPVGSRWVSPDGAHYAFPLVGDIFVQNVAGGPGLDLANGEGLTVLDVDNAGVYAIKPNAPGLRYLPFSGAEKQVSASDFWQGVSHGFAYGTITSSVPAGATNTILRLDVQRGTVINFFSQSGGMSGLTGFDLQGHPIVQVTYQGGAAVYLVTGLNSSMAIAGTSEGYGMFPYGQPIADSHGLWWGGGGIILFANGRWYWMSSLSAQLAGPCL